MGSAIVVDHSRNDRTGKHAYLVPRVMGDIYGVDCAKKLVLPKKLRYLYCLLAIAKGKAGSNYIKGWDEI